MYAGKRPFGASRKVALNWNWGYNKMQESSFGDHVTLLRSYLEKNVGEREHD